MEIENTALLLTEVKAIQNKVLFHINEDINL